MKTVACVIGVSKYQDPKLTQLPGAAGDADRFVTFLKSWNIPSRWIYTLRNEQATKAAIIKLFYDLRSEVDHETKLIFYFSGHGERTLLESIGPHAESSLLFFDTGLRLVELMQLIRSLNPLQAFLFFDACHLRFNTFENPLNEMGLFSNTNSRGLFCLFSSGVNSSFEDPDGKGGYFTTALIKGFEAVRHVTKPTISDILKVIESYHLQHVLPLPESCQIGHVGLWPFERHYSDVSSTAPSSMPTVLRKVSLAHLKSLLATTTHPVIWMYGERGLGKSVIAEQLQKSLPEVLLISVPHLENLSHVYQILIEQIRSQKSELFFNRPAETTFIEVLRYLLRKCSRLILIVDHLDRLNTDHLNEVIDQLDRVSLPMVLISRFRCPHFCFKQRRNKILKWQAKALSEEEIREFIYEIGIEDSFAKAVTHSSKGNALKMRALIQRFGNATSTSNRWMTKQIIYCMTALASAGGFLDQELFCTTFNISQATISTLEFYGLIRYCKEKCFPHDRLEEIVEKKGWPLQLEKACKYWHNQVLKTPYNQFACRSLVLHAKIKEDCQSIKNSLILAMKTLGERENRIYLLDLAEIFNAHQWSDLVLMVCDELVNHEEYKRAGLLLKDFLTSSNTKHRIWAIKIEIRRLVWIGKYTDALNLYEHIAKRRLPMKHAVAIRNHIGIAHFFLGNFDRALILFEKNTNHFEIDDIREKGIQHYMMGLIFTYRVYKMSQARNYLESSIGIFESIKAFHWTIVGLNGLSVHYNFIGKKKLALLFLDKALELSQALQNHTFQIQTLKNILRVKLRVYSANSEEVVKTIVALEKVLSLALDEVGHNWATMWAQNILCTAYALRKDIKKMKSMVCEVMQLTKDYDECHIFSLSNRGHFAALSGKSEEAKAYYIQAYTLCKKVKIPLVELEIRQDFLDCGFPLHYQEFIFQESS